ncbi:non-ribosomal peptide synthetase [Brevibacillus fortis]|uniref:Non-ribosomal peptide synthetase n=1 Tax=Brevibacillus fortis TaxID=2126352 RepID=A0A2P7V8H3_9BACL|nr:non-ribosomal peptide synthetase [Brevibacillus fortis]PSJ95510.1 non-ribosomal peptide synthetase [Brevibacillus fortis]
MRSENPDQFYRLSHAQKRIWYIENLYPDTSINLQTISSYVQQDINFEVLEEAITLFMRKHESIRLRLSSVDGEIKQYFSDFDPIHFETIYFNMYENPWEEFDRRLLAKEYFQHNMLDTPLFAIYFFKIEDRQGFIFKIHHIISDGWSNALFVNFIWDYYQAQGDPSLQSSLLDTFHNHTFSYIDYLEKEAAYLDSSDRFIKNENFWLEKYADLPERAMTDSKQIKANRKTYLFTDEQSASIRNFISDNQKSYNTFFTSVMYVYLHKVYNIEDIVLGTPVYNRAGKEERALFGMCTSTLPLRLKSSPNVTISELMTYVHQETKRSYIHQKYPFDLLFPILQTKHGNLESLHDVTLNFLNSKSFHKINGVPVISEWHFTGQQIEPLQVSIREGNEHKLTLYIDYKTDQFSDEEIDLIYWRLKCIISEILDKKNIRLKELQLLDQSERKVLLEDFNDTEKELKKKSVHEMFAEQASLTPDNIAIVFKERSLTYAELDRKTNQLARLLQAKGVGEESVVGVMMVRSDLYLLSILAILKTGAVILPLDPDYPQERIRYMLNDSRPILILTDGSKLEELYDEQTVLSIDQALTSATGMSSSHVLRSRKDPGPLYIIYTSGSTGTPKGIIIEHGTITNLIQWQQTEMMTDLPYPKILQFASINFDVCYQEIFSALLCGAELHVIPDEQKGNPEAVVQFIAENELEVVYFSTAYLKYVASEIDLLKGLFKGRLRHLIVAGEQLVINPDLRSFLQENEVILHNHYGPSETHVVTALAIHPKSGNVPSIPSIGRPIWNTGIYIISPDFDLQPIGVSGELCISGVGLARSYVNLPDMTSEKFITNPFDPEKRMYRTGDLARWLPDGNIEYLGRMDNQVKIRGFRVELGEVETHLLDIESIKETVVVPWKDVYGQVQLCAYFVDDGHWTPRQLRTILSKELPGYMIPSCYIRMERLPLTANGKVDSKALPAPETSMLTEEEGVGPRNALEQKLHEVWQDVLQIQSISIEDNFFDIGGHSLRAATLVTKLHKELHINLSLREVFQTQTIEQMAQVIRGKEKVVYTAIPVIEDRESYPLSSAQKRMYILNHLEDGKLIYNMPGMLLIEGLLCRFRLETAFRDLISRHETLRTGFEMVEGEPSQRIYREVDFALDFHIACEEEATKLFRTFIRPFDLKKAPLLRVGLIQITSERHLLFIDMHHIIADGVSISILLRDLVHLYNGTKLPDLRIQYKDYAVWQQSNLQDIMKRQEAYWLDVLSGDLPNLELPLDYSRPSIQTYNGQTFRFVIEAQTREGIRHLSEDTGTTLFMVLLAVYTLMLHKYTGQEDIIVGTPIAGRSHEDLYPLMGMFVNTLAIRSYPRGDQSFLSFLEEVRQTTLGAFEHQDYPFDQLVDRLQIQRDVSRNPVFNTLFTLHNEINLDVQMDGLLLKRYPSDYSISKFDLSFDVTECENGLECSFEYATALFDPDTIERMAKHYSQLIRSIVEDPSTKLAHIRMITPAEETKILHEFSSPEYANYSREKTINILFEEQVVRTPEQIAVWFEGERITYKELNEKANRLARTLRAQCVQPDQLVGILAERSLEMIIGILAVLKSGGAFVPIDPGYPAERIEFMLEDSQVEVLLAQTHLKEKAFFAGRWIMLDESVSYAEESTNLVSIHAPTNLGYVIYTSGTTGRPKGVMIEHQQMMVMASAWNQAYQLENAAIRWLQTASFSFDVFTGDWIRALLFGGELILCSSYARLNPAEMYELFRKHNIQAWDTTPAIVIPFMDYVYENRLDIDSLQLLVIGADHFPVEEYLKLFKRYGTHMRILNSYGVTETCIDACYFEQSTFKPLMRVPIGKALPSVHLYILNAELAPQPIGVVGELYIGGDCVGRGYFNDLVKTSQKFVDNPYQLNGKIYRTGDLARWLPDGNVEYLGRLDDQIKFNGYRIELGEIESQLLSIVGIKRAIAITRDEYEQKRLCAYFVGDRPYSSNELRDALLEKLPAYMIPTHFVQLPQLPLTPNGKVDRKALPAPSGRRMTESSYESPRNTVESVLVSIWQSVLGVEKIGIRDHFFELGGDSIKSIQVASRLYQAGYRLNVKDLFKYTTIAKISAFIVPVSRVAEQGTVEGPSKLTPIQHWFNQVWTVDPHHFNQAVMLFRKQGWDEGSLCEALEKIVVHHDALRTVLRESETGVEAWIRGVQEGELFSLEVFDFRNMKNPAQYIEIHANEIQSSICLKNGPLVKGGLFRCVDGDHLLIVIHHFVVDGISWRILLDDLATGYEQSLAGDTICLPKKTDSFRDWTEQLSLFSQSSLFQSDREYWRQGGRFQHECLLAKNTQEMPVAKDIKNVIVLLNNVETEQLLKLTHRAYNTEVNDLLLTALGLAIHHWTGMKHVLINLESHGREGIPVDLDISRTVGWFTSEFPVYLEIREDLSIGMQIKYVKEQLRQIPHKGMGFGIEKYLNPFHHGDDLAFAPEISFNYLGQFDQNQHNSIFQQSPFSSGNLVSPRSYSTYSIDINGVVSNGTLSFVISYNTIQYDMEEIESFAVLLKESLQAVISHCVGKEKPELTPSDIGMKGMTIEALDLLADRISPRGQLENVYTLTPMQKGILFQSLLEPSTYFSELSFDFHGALDIDHFKRSLDCFIQRHEALRTNFLLGGNGEYQQVVFKKRQSEFLYRDLTEMEKDHQEQYISNLIIEEKARGFDLGTDTLLRVFVLRKEEQVYQMIWNTHHIIMDGWSLSLMLNEIFDTYSILMRNELPRDVETVSFSRYIAWLDQQDEKAAVHYWREYLAGFEYSTELPFGLTSSGADGYVSKQLRFNLGKEWSQRLQEMASKHEVTLNTLIQTAWGILLQKYNNHADVIFGSVVSGRPAELRGVESIIGLFINTIPVRIKAEETDSFADVMRKTQEQALASLAYDTYPLYEIQTLSDQRQDLIKHLMVFENYPMDKQLEQFGNDGGASFALRNIKSAEQTNYDFNVIIVPSEDIEVCFGYNASVYNESDVVSIQKHWMYLLAQIMENPYIHLPELELLAEKDKRKIREEFNSQVCEYPRKTTIHGLFEGQVERTPDMTAVVYEDKHLTYRELNEKSNRLARKLRSQGVKPDHLVGLMVERSIEMIVGVLAILKAGGAFVPIDPNYPEERINYMLADSGAKHLLLQNHLKDRVVFDGKRITLGEESGDGEDGSNLAQVAEINHLAYVIYTSGTTGKPKGVMLEHRGVCNLKALFDQKLSIREHDNVIQFASLSFDASVWEIFQALFCGATLFVPTNATILNFQLFERYMAEHRISIATLPPSYATYLDPKQMSHLRVLITAGSASSPQLVLKWSPHLMYFNAYGPTEDSIATTIGSVVLDPTGSSKISIGCPISNHQVYILDAFRNLQPVGVVGELCIAGVGLARGYLGSPALTLEKFVENPFVPGERMYRSGDLARWLPDGSLEYVGRIDQQVKIRGYRIELGEVEEKLLGIDGVLEAVAISREDEAGQAYLCAYFTGDQKRTFNELRVELSKQLPQYMLPSYLMKLERFPLTPNGKVDRKLLPKPADTLKDTDVPVAASTQTQARLIGLFAEVLGIPEEQIGIYSNFFELGGHSLMILNLLTKSFLLNWNLNIKDFYDFHTIEEIAAKIDGKSSGKTGIDDTQIEWIDLRGELHQETQSKVLRRTLGEVLLLGATGFLGIHVLYELLTKTDASIHCIIRGSNRTMVFNRLKDKMRFYYKSTSEVQLQAWFERIRVYAGDISDSGLGIELEELLRLGDTIDTVINTAALVKHFGFEEDFDKSNVLIVQNLVDFCLYNQIPLHHVSTMSVSGSTVPGDSPGVVTFTENDFYVGQNYKDNVYIRSKFEAEKLIYEKLKKGLRGSVYRVGNLTGRFSDGVFQENIEENMFYMNLKSIMETGIMSSEMLSQPVEFTPVDICAEAIVSIIQTETEGKTFHIYNHHYVLGQRLYDAFQASGFSIRVMAAEDLERYIEQTLRGDGGSGSFGVRMLYAKNEGTTDQQLPRIVQQSTFTIAYLKKLNFEYPEIDLPYLRNLLDYILLVNYVRKT